MKTIDIKILSYDEIPLNRANTSVGYIRGTLL